MLHVPSSSSSFLLLFTTIAILVLVLVPAAVYQLTDSTASPPPSFSPSFSFLLSKPKPNNHPASTFAAAMAWRCSGRSNSELIANLFQAGMIKAPRVRDAMNSVDRAHYCPSSPLAAYEDSPQPIGFKATISAPHMHASACESLLEFMPENKGAKVLDIGSGSGYLTHVMANIVCGPDGKGDGKVVGIDHIQGLVDMARQNMERSQEGRELLASGRVELVTGDGRKGYPAGGPYDAIHVGAAAKELHQDLVDQLNSPGRMFIPVDDSEGRAGQWIWVVDKDKDGNVTRRKEFGVRYVPLTDAPK